MSDIEAKQKIEINHWRSKKADSIKTIVQKITEAGVFLNCLNCLKRYKDELITNGRVLEIGGGQGWASCVYKKIFPDAHLLATDISEFAIMDLHHWERLFEVKIDNAYACKSYEIKEVDASLDQIFCFASAHHFLAHKRTLYEINRVLKPGGKAFYFYEPSVPRYLSSLAHWRVNRKRPKVPEDVLITSKLRSLAQEAGLDIRVEYYPSLIKRGAFETFYFFVLSHIPILQRLLPCSANFIFTKKTPNKP